ncbi:MAG: ABC transporter permease subunit [Clostridiales bacterium]|nr:ABC transporter permease subunit [Clostridiales bacterium]
MEVAAKKKKKGSLIKDLRRHWAAYLMLIPAVVLLFIFSYIPMYGIIIAFKHYKPQLGIWGSPWVGLEHFAKFFTSAHFPVLLRNTLSISVYSLLAGYPCSIILALLLNEVRCAKYKKVVQTISYMPYFISSVVVCGMLKSFLSYDGMFNALNNLMGREPISFLSEPKYFQHIIVWAGVWQGMGWNSIIYMAALSAIDTQLYEAARIDGCGRLRQAWHVTIPGIMPTVIMLLIMSVGSILTVGTDNILLLYNPMTYETGDVFGTYTYRLGIRGGQYDYTAAVGLAETVVGFIMIVVVNWISRKTTEQSLW